MSEADRDKTRELLGTDSDYSELLPIVRPYIEEHRDAIYKIMADTASELSENPTSRS